MPDWRFLVETVPEPAIPGVRALTNVTQAARSQCTGRKARPNALGAIDSAGLRRNSGGVSNRAQREHLPLGGRHLGHVAPPLCVLGSRVPDGPGGDANADGAVDLFWGCG